MTPIVEIFVFSTAWMPFALYDVRSLAPVMLKEIHLCQLFFLNLHTAVPSYMPHSILPMISLDDKLILSVLFLIFDPTELFKVSLFFSLFEVSNFFPVFINAVLYLFCLNYFVF